MRRLFAVLLLWSALAAAGYSQTKCEANINGFKIHRVYVMGDQYNGVVWAYRHLSESTCLTPVTSIENADAILEVYSTFHPRPASQDASDAFSVSCSSSGSGTLCSDSDGNMMTVDCSGGVCSSYYGPNPLVAVGKLLNMWVRNGWEQAEAKIYTRDNKLLWRSTDQKGHFPDQWPDKIREGTNSPICKRPAAGSWDAHKYKNYRNWGEQKCGIVFDPEVSIDLHLQEKQNAAKQQQDERNQIVQNAKDAAAKQKQ